MSQHLMETYQRLPVSFVKGKGSYLFDQEGNQYLDSLAGISVCNLGHAHPHIHKEVSDQLGTLVHTSNVYQIPLQQQLADRLCELSSMDRVFFGNSGAEANEAAIKIGRLYGHQQGIETPELIVMDGSFHGRTMATLSATGNRKVRAGFEPLLKGFTRVPFGQIDDLRNLAANNSNIVGILVEPIQGEGGVNVPPEDYLDQIRQLCDENDWLMMLDEIQTGMGRTGKLFAHQHSNSLPDVMTLAKALGNGIPIGACLARGKAAEVLSPGTHGSTFGGNPLASRAALAVLDLFERDQVVDQCAATGKTMRDAFEEKLKDQPLVVAIRGKGLMIGIELTQDCPELVALALEKRLLINVAAGNTIRLLPPLNITTKEANQIVTDVCSLITELAEATQDIAP